MPAIAMHRPFAATWEFWAGVLSTFAALGLLLALLR
jgi:hypothetical protein